MTTGDPCPKDKEKWGKQGARAALRLTVIIATYNRAELLQRAIASIFEASRPDGLEVRVVVVTNNCSDDTERVITRCIERHGSRLSFFNEPRQGKSWALNSAIAKADGDLVGIIDDDERVCPERLEIIDDAFQDPKLDFIGGPYAPEWSCTPPRWLPRECPAIIGGIRYGDAIRAYSPEFSGMLLGGNCVLRPRCFERVGLYNTGLGRTNRGLVRGWLPGADPAVAFNGELDALRLIGLLYHQATLAKAGEDQPPIRG